MISQPPREPAWISWSWVAAWTLFIYYTITRAREIQAFVTKSLGREWFSYMVYAAIAAACLWAVFRLARSPVRIKRSQATWIAVVVVTFTAWTWKLGTGAPEEALHFVEYGVLAVLLFRAFSHSVRDPAIYVCGVMAGCIIGTVDEVIQWVTPKRYFDFKDILLNVSACVLVLVGLGKGLRPAYILPGIARRSAMRACMLGWIAWGLLMLCLGNTPAVRHAYEERFPWIAHAFRHAHTMTEFGNLYVDPDYGIFRSRLSLEALAAEDARRAEEAAAILDQYHPMKTYSDFLDRYPEFVDPFLHEVRVHLYRRDRYRHRAEELRDEDPKGYRYHRTVAYRENGLVERYWTNTLSRSVFQLKPESVARLKAEQDPDLEYESGVSRALITWCSPRAMMGWAALVCLVWTLGWGYVYCRRPAEPENPVIS